MSQNEAGRQYSVQTCCKRLLSSAQLAEDLVEVGVGTSLLPCCYPHELSMRFAY